MILTKILNRLRKIYGIKNIPLQSRESFALNNLDKKLYPYLKFRNGFYIEAGANDGITQSNTLFFEKYQNWKGLLIEPIPEIYQQCKVNRPKAIVENYALVPFDFKESFIEMRFSNLMSLVKGAMKTEEEELHHIARGCDVQQVQTYEVKVPVTTLSNLLDRHHIKKIDLLSLDVEGFELSVLKGINMKKHAPTYILVEARFREEIDTYLSEWYIPIAELSHHDILYKKKSFWQKLWN